MDGRPYLLIGIGNADRRDDGVGPYLARTFSDPDWECLNAGIAPESYTSFIKKKNPRLIVLVDATEMELPPGSVRRLPLNRIDSFGSGTHAMPLSFFIKFLERDVRADMIVLGIQPEEIVNREGLSPVVEQAAKKVEKILSRRAFEEITWWG